MAPDDINARQKIYQATLDLIAAGEDADTLTTRQIAAKAGVNSALVNYYYQTKENLLTQVVGMMMGGVIDGILKSGVGDADAATRLRSILLATVDIAFQPRYHGMCKIALAAELRQGYMNTGEMVMPLLQEMAAGRSRTELRIAVLQLMLPFHHIALDPILYGRLLNTDFYDELQRRHTISCMIDSVLAGLCREEEQT